MLLKSSIIVGENVGALGDENEGLMLWLEFEEGLFEEVLLGSKDGLLEGLRLGSEDGLIEGLRLGSKDGAAEGNDNIEGVRDGL